MNRQNTNPGFTLIEMLVALTMIAAIVSMVYGSYAATSRSMEVYDSRMTCSQRTDLVVRLIARQLRCAYTRPTELNQTASGATAGNPGSDRGKQELSQSAEIQTLKSRPAFVGNQSNSKGEILDFVTTAGLSGGLTGSQRLTRVRYRYDSSLKMLAVSSQPPVDSGRKNDSAVSWQPLLWQVSNVELEFYDGSDWRPEWSSRSKQGLPRAVRIRLAVEDEKGRTYHCGTTVEILNQATRHKTAGESR